MQRPASTPSVTSTRWFSRGWLMHLHDAADGSGLGIARTEDQASDARMDDGSGAHRAGLQRDVELAAAEPVVAQRARGLAQGLDLGVRAWDRCAETTWFQPRPTMCPSQTTTAPTGTSPATSASRASRSASSIQRSSGTLVGLRPP